jgi:Carboxypeptidase regulatory-like domain
MPRIRALARSWLTTIAIVAVAISLPTVATARTSRAAVDGTPAALRSRPAADRVPTAQVGTLIGVVTAPAVTGGPASLPVTDELVTATSLTGIRYTTTTAANGWYDLEQVPPGIYVATVSEPAPATGTASVSVLVDAGDVTTSPDLQLAAPVATITGAITGGRGGPLAGMPVALSSPDGDDCSTTPACGTNTTSGQNGRYTVYVPPGTYTLQTLDAGQPTAARTVVAPAGGVLQAPITLPAPPVPAGATAHQSARDLRRLNAERTADGLPAGLTLAPRWSAECAAHDDYERDNGVLTSAENPESPDASVGGAWAGLSSDLAEGRWTPTANPWENAPIHLLALLAPSLAIVGIDDSNGYQCVTTYPGLVRAPTSTDRIFTYPADGARGVVPSERARESPFVPGQFVGIPGGRATGRELFVYLNLAHQSGQAPVQVLSATLTARGHRVALRWVDSQTPTVGRYLPGAILIPVEPLRPRTRYTASVSVQDRSATLTRRWSFATR